MLIWLTRKGDRGTIESQNMPLGGIGEDEFDSEIQLIQLELGQGLLCTRMALLRE